MTQAQVQADSKSLEIIGRYRSFLDMIRTELPKVDQRLVLEMLMHYYKFHAEQPRIRLEIVYTENVDASEKKEEIYARTGRASEVRDNHIILIDSYFRLQDIEDLARDNQVRVIRGEIIP